MHTADQARFDSLYQDLLNTLKRHGKASKTVEAYARGVRRLTRFYDRCPVDLTVAELNAYFDSLIQSHSWSTVRTDRNGIQFFYKYILNRDMPWVNMLKPPRVQSLPDVLTHNEIASIIQKEIEEFGSRLDVAETGTVLEVGGKALCPLIEKRWLLLGKPTGGVDWLGWFVWRSCPAN